MITDAPPAIEPPLPPQPSSASTTSPWPAPNTITVGLLCWAAISAGFFGLKLLMQERPEFVGQPSGAAKVEMIQESPAVVMRKVSDDVSVIKPMQPEEAEVRFDMAGRRDYRGLRTVMDMSGNFHARYFLTNILDEAVFVLFQCPHPHPENQAAGSLLASGLRLQASIPGDQENQPDAWVWSGTLEPRSGANIEVSYQAASLKGATYRISSQNGVPVKQLHLAFHRKDLDSMRFASGDGPQASTDETVTWERRDFLAPDSFSGDIVEARNVYESLSQLLEIGPLICLLFLVAMTAAIFARQTLSALQMMTIAAVYALYFPLILYLSAHLSFPVAVVIAAVVPGALLVNYARWLLGARRGLVGGVVFLALYWVFPTLAAFAGWNRGMELLCLGVVTLWVLINLQNQALRRKAVLAAGLLLLAWPLPGFAGDTSAVNFAPVQYQVRDQTNYFRVEAEAPFQILRFGENTVTLFGAPVYLEESHLESLDTNLAFIITITNRLALLVERTGKGTLRVSYRVPVENRDGKRRAEIPLLAGASGNLHLASARNDFEILAGSLWSKNTTDKTTVYDIGVTGADTLPVEWRVAGGDASAIAAKPAGQAKETPLVPAKTAEPAKNFYGIGLTRAQHLTVINSDGSCTHFAEFEMPAFQGEEFRMKLPAKARLISASVNGIEIHSPGVEDQICRVQLPGREAQPTVDRVSFRIAYPPLRLGFIGAADLTLPEVFQTTGTTEWVVALPNGFETQVVSSGLELQKNPPDLTRFGDYGRILQTHARTYLAKDLAPPGLVGLNLKYRQVVPGFSSQTTAVNP